MSTTPNLVQKGWVLDWCAAASAQYSVLPFFVLGFAFRFSYLLTAVLLAGSAGLLLDAWRRKTTRTWFWCPSNLLILVGVFFDIWMQVADAWDDVPYSESIGGLMIAAAYVIRRWEDDAIKVLPEDDAGEASDEKP